MSHGPFRPFGRLLVPGALLLSAAATFTPPLADATASTPTVVVTAPTQVELGTPIEISFSLTAADDVAGLELSARFDDAAVGFGGLYFGDGTGTAGDIVTAVAAQPGVGVTGLAFTCRADGCPSAGSSRTDLVSSRLRLETVEAGHLTIALGPIEVVDSSGNVLDVNVPSSTIEIDVVGADGSNHPAPSSALVLPAPGPTSSTTATDLTGDGRVDYGDVADLVSRWSDARALGSCSAPTVEGAPSGDLDGNGCIDVGDVQRIAGPSSGLRTENGPALRTEVAGQPWVVTTVNDEPDTNVGDGKCATASGGCSLRAAMYEANATAGPDTINFAIPGGGVQTIQLHTALPIVNDSSGGLTIDGYSQPGAQPNTDPLASNAAITVQIRGNGDLPDSGDGFKITSANNVIRGLAIFNVFNHIEMNGPNASGNVVVGNFIGTDATANFDSPDDNADGGVGVKIDSGGHDNIIGRPNLADRNVVAGTSGTGIMIEHDGSDSNIVQNNILGLLPSGAGGRPNGWGGVDMQFGAAYNYIGGLGQYERNVISGEPRDGIDFSHDATTTQNRAVGNFIGTTLDGESVTSFTRMGYNAASFKDNALDNYFYENVVGGAQHEAIWNKQDYTGRNYVYNNRIGVSRGGRPLPNASYGMLLKGHDFQVGPGNVFANNALGGIIVASNPSVNNRISGNSFTGNGGLAIDLAPGHQTEAAGGHVPDDGFVTGTTANDADDADKGPNTLLNYPVVTSATTTSAAGTACAGCRVEIYRADVDPGNRGEGNRYLGFTTAAADGAFSGSIVPVNIGDRLAAIAIDAAGNTSEFSVVFTVNVVGTPAVVTAPPPGTPGAPGAPGDPSTGSLPPTSGTPSSYSSVLPARLMDTRPGHATVDGAFAETGMLGNGSTTELKVTGRGGVPLDATAITLNVTVTEASGPGFVTVYPCGSPQPLASSLNYVSGQTVPNAVVSKVGVGGSVCLYTLLATHLVVDVDGYFPPSSGFDPLVPARLADTRIGFSTVDGQSAGTGAVGADQTLVLNVTGRGGVPADATAVVLNVTSTNAQGPGYLTVYPCGSARPLASNVNYALGQTVPNAVITPIGQGGRVCIYTQLATDIVVDVNGSFPPGSTFQPVVPGRVLDTRTIGATIDGQNAAGGALVGGQVITLQIAGRAGVAADAVAAVLNVTATDATGAGFVTVFPCGATQPLASNVNFVAGVTSPNTVITGLASNGTVCLYASVTTHLVVDVDGFIAQVS